MTRWEYCEVDFDGGTTFVYYYDEAGDYIDRPEKHARLGHDGWEIISSWWRDNRRVTYMLKRPVEKEWTLPEREQARQKYAKNFPRDVR